MFSRTCHFCRIISASAFFILFIMFVGCMVHIISFKFPFCIVLGSPIPIFSISGNIIFLFIYSIGFNIIYYLNITIVEVPSFSVVFGAGLGSVTSYYLNICKDRSFFPSNLDKQVVSAIILTSLGYVLVHYFTHTMLLYFSLALLLRSPSRNSITVS